MVDYTKVQRTKADVALESIRKECKRWSLRRNRGTDQKTKKCDGGGSGNR